MVKGSCLCGGVTISINGKVSDIGYCHCSKCRKVSGVNSNGVLMTAAKSFQWLSGEELVNTYSMQDGWTSTFCKQCGCPLPMTAPNGKLLWIPIGMLDDEPKVSVAEHIYVGSKASWEVIGDAAPQYDENSPQTSAAER